MKKIIALSLLSIGLQASAQQVQGDFDQAWEKCYPWVAGSNVSTARGTQPVGWHVSNVNGAGGTGASDALVTSDTGRSGSGYAVKMQNVWVGMNILGLKIGAYAPGYLTLGTPWNASKGQNNKDGGTFGGKEFTYKPDAVGFYYKGNASSNCKASFIGYMWKGTTSQVNVPAETTAGASPTTVTMIDRDRNILGKATSQGGTVTNNSTLIASFEEYVTNEAKDWTYKEIPFEYKTNDTPEKLNLIFCSTDYFNSEVPSVDNALYVDDVKMIYYHALSDLKYNGTTISGFSETTKSYTLKDEAYDASKVSYTKKGVGATVETSYDAATCKLTITVKGNDYESDNTSLTTYTIQFKKTLTLTDTEAPSVAGKFNEIVVKRSFKQGWNTICLPFAFKLSDLPAGAKLQMLNSVTSDVLQFKNIESSGTTKAGYPYLLYLPNALDSYTFTFSSTKSVSTSEPSSWQPNAEFTFTGTYTPMQMEGKYGVADVDDVQKLMLGGSNSSIKGLRGYFTKSGVQAQSYAIVFEGETTGIIDAKGEVTEDGPVYNLQGIRVANSLKQLPAGLYIVNGRKVLVK